MAAARRGAFIIDGRIEAGNNAAERALRALAVGRKNFLHLGSDAGGHSASVICTLIGTAKLNGISPQHYLHHAVERIADHSVNHIDELVPWAVADQIAPAAQEDQGPPPAASASAPSRLAECAHAHQADRRSADGQQC